MDAHHHGAHAQDDGEHGYEPDVRSEQMTTIGIYFVVLTALFFASVFGLFVYFRFESDQLVQQKIVPDTKRVEQRQAGAAGVADVDAAMKAIMAEQAKAKGN